MFLFLYAFPHSLSMSVISFVTFCWAVAGRTLVRELAFKKEAQDELGEATLKQEVRRGLDSTLKLLTYLLTNRSV